MSKKHKYYFALSIAITVGFVLLGFFMFNKSYLRLGEAFVDLWNSIKYYFCEIFGIEHATIPTVEFYSKIMKWDILLPTDFENFKSDFVHYFTLLFSKENFVMWGMQTSKVLENIGKIMVIVLPCLLILWFSIKKLYNKPNNNYNQDTLPLKVYKSISKVTYFPLKRFVFYYKEFLQECSYFYILWITMTIFHLNLISIIIEFIAYYLYFSVSFKVSTIYVQFCKLFIDLNVVFKTIPIWLLIPLILLVFNRFRKRIAMSKLRHFEARDCGFINELPIVSMACGSMGKKKTTLVTDMALSQEVMFRQKALSILQNVDIKFPHFPWICFEQELQKCMEFGTVYNLATVKVWIKKKRSRFAKHRDKHLQLYGYDFKNYGENYNDALRISNLFDILETYAGAYFIYIITSSLLISNYSIRTDNRMQTLGNFPMWNTDFFPNRLTRGRHSHILDFDILRLGKKVMENNPNAGSFEFGVVVITEVGKERGNSLELKEIKKGADEANPKNDLFNSWLKMCRHSATVDNFPFIKVFTDEQRPESWGADSRDLCDIIQIVKSGEQKIALPFYTIEEMIAEWSFNWFTRFYYDIRFKRSDNTLLVHILKSIVHQISSYNLRVYNNFGYSVLKIEKERGTMDGKVERKKYFLMNKKIYSRRFSTDCFSDYFNDLAKKCKIGLNDYLEYASEKATVAELKAQHSYFIDSMY